MRTALVSLGVLAALLLGEARAEARDLNGVDGYVGHAGRWFTDQEGRTMSFRGLVLPLRKAPYSLDVQGVTTTTRRVRAQRIQPDAGPLHVWRDRAASGRL